NAALHLPGAGRRRTWLTQAPARPRRSRCCLLEARCRAARSPPFGRKVGIDPLAEPRLVRAPAQAFALQHLMDAAAAHREAVRLLQINRQTGERPAGKRLAQRLWVGEGSGYDQPHLLARVGGRTATMRGVCQPSATPLVEALDPQT